jgi:hypothetical protein
MDHYQHSVIICSRAVKYNSGYRASLQIERSLCRVVGPVDFSSTSSRVNGCQVDVRQQVALICRGIMLFAGLTLKRKTQSERVVVLDELADSLSEGVKVERSQRA